MLAKVATRLCNKILTDAQCLDIEFRDSDLKGANLIQASFLNQVSSNMYFCSAYITGCNLSYANIEGQRLEKYDLLEQRRLIVLPD